jgi:hypothetical protein
MELDWLISQNLPPVYNIELHAIQQYEEHEARSKDVDG